MCICNTVAEKRMDDAGQTGRANSCRTSRPQAYYGFILRTKRTLSGDRPVLAAE